jgi:hypothetical protein
VILAAIKIDFAQFWQSGKTFPVIPPLTLQIKNQFEFSRKAITSVFLSENFVKPESLNRRNFLHFMLIANYFGVLDVKACFPIG